MSYIQLRKSDIEQVQRKLSGLGNDLSSMSESVGRLEGNLDMQVSARQNIEDRLISIKADLKKQSDMIMACSKFLGSVLEAFSAIDNLYQSEAQAPVFGQAGSIGAALGAISHLGNNAQEIWTNWVTQSGIDEALENFDLFAQINSYEPSGLAELFLSDEQQETISVYLSEFEDYLLGTRKSIKGIIKMLEAYDIALPQEFAAFFTDSEISSVFDCLELWDDGTDLLDALGTEEAGEEFGDFLLKYGKKGVEKAWGSNYGAKWLVNCIVTYGENILSAGDYFSADATASENIMGGLEYVTSIVLSGVEGTFDLSVDLMDGIGSIFGADVEGYLTETYGGEKGEALMNMWGELFDTTFDAIDSFGVVSTMEAYGHTTNSFALMDYLGITDEVFTALHAGEDAVMDFFGIENDVAATVVYPDKKGVIEYGMDFVEDAVSDFLDLFK